VVGWGDGSSEMEGRSMQVGRRGGVSFEPIGLIGASAALHRFIHKGHSLV